MTVTAALYQNSDQKPQVQVLDTDGVSVIPASSYADATYRIFQTGSCTPVLSKDLGAGITVNGDNFEIEILDTEITFSGTNGEYTHQFRVGDIVGERLAPIFDQLVDIIPACPA